MLAITAPPTLLFGSIAIRPVRELTHRTVLTSSQLLFPAPLRGWRTIELTDVVSMAVHYEGNLDAGVEAVGAPDRDDRRRIIALPVDDTPASWLGGCAADRRERRAGVAVAP